jgi:hypothetical protein
MFGSRCRPVGQTTQWPGRGKVSALLRDQLARMLELFLSQAPRLAEIAPDPPGDWQLVRGIIHGLHDEARHQGEMYLLLKLCRARREAC